MKRNIFFHEDNSFFYHKEKKSEQLVLELKWAVSGLFCLPVESISMVLKRMYGNFCPWRTGREPVEECCLCWCAFGVPLFPWIEALPKLGSGTVKTRAAIIMVGGTCSMCSGLTPTDHHSSAPMMKKEVTFAIRETKSPVFCHWFAVLALLNENEPKVFLSLDWSLPWSTPPNRFS